MASSQGLQRMSQEQGAIPNSFSNQDFKSKKKTAGVKQDVQGQQVFQAKKPQIPFPQASGVMGSSLLMESIKPALQGKSFQDAYSSHPNMPVTPREDSDFGQPLSGAKAP